MLWDRSSRDQGRTTEVDEERRRRGGSDRRGWPGWRTSGTLGRTSCRAAQRAHLWIEGEGSGRPFPRDALASSLGVLTRRLRLTVEQWIGYVGFAGDIGLAGEAWRGKEGDESQTSKHGRRWSTLTLSGRESTLFSVEALAQTSKGRRLEHTSRRWPHRAPLEPFAASSFEMGPGARVGTTLVYRSGRATDEEVDGLK